jgi:hypothetical protein
MEKEKTLMHFSIQQNMAVGFCVSICCVLKIKELIS